MSIFAELWSFMRARKKFWLLPIFLMMLILGGLLVLAKTSAIAPHDSPRMGKSRSSLRYPLGSKSSR